MRDKTVVDRSAARGGKERWGSPFRVPFQRAPRVQPERNGWMEVIVGESRDGRREEGGEPTSCPRVEGCGVLRGRVDRLEGDLAPVASIGDGESDGRVDERCAEAVGFVFEGKVVLGGCRRQFEDEDGAFTGQLKP